MRRLVSIHHLADTWAHALDEGPHNLPSGYNQPQVKVFAGDAPDGNFLPVEDDPVLRGQRACLFQHVFHGRFYGYDCHLETPEKWVLEEVEAPLP